MKPRIPPLHALQALDAFARLGTVWEAAEDLGITRSAVSHRFGLLESALGFELAARSGKGWRLTPRGKRYARMSASPLRCWRRRTKSGRGSSSRATLAFRARPDSPRCGCAITSAPFTSIPRSLAADRHRHELDEASDRDADLSSSSATAIGRGIPFSISTTSNSYPVQPCAQEHARRIDPAQRRAALSVATSAAVDEWRQWLTMNGVEFPRSTGVSSPDLMLVQSAAIAGQGVMMGDEITCAGALAAGQLVTPFSSKIKSRGGYYLLRSRQRRPSPAMSAFTRWLNALVHAHRHGTCRRQIPNTPRREAERASAPASGASVLAAEPGKRLESEVDGRARFLIRNAGGVAHDVARREHRQHLRRNCSTSSQSPTPDSGAEREVTPTGCH